jgi:hypothetical protein
MRRRLAYVLAPLFAAGLSFAFLHACTQAEGEKCQVDSDCDTSKDICNEGTGLCQAKGTASADAIPAPDAHVDAGPPDATTFDAAIDGGVDATPADAN